MNGLLREHRRLVVAVVRRQWKGERAAYGDLVQEGMIALWRAIMGFDPGRGLAFSTYAWRAIERAVWAAVARAERPEGWQRVARVANPATVVGARDERVQRRAALVEAVRQLPPRLAHIVMALYGLDGLPPQTLAAVGEGLGLTGERVRQLRNDALVYLRLPALSHRLCQLTSHNDRAAYRRMAQLTRHWLHRRRGRQP